MITAYSKTIGNWVQVDGLVNRGRWFGKRWLIGIGMGFECLMLVVEADNEGDAIDEIVDSPTWSHILVHPDQECHCEDYNDCTCSWGGNFGLRLRDVEYRVFKKLGKKDINYFSKKGDI